MLEGGVRSLQVRIKRTPQREALAAVHAIVLACQQAGAVCLVNDRVDWVLLTGAHGVHLGEDDLPIDAARRLLGPDRLVGGTVRDAAGAARAKALGADYVGLGPLFATGTKRVPAPVLGLEAFAGAVRESPLPVVAIGGISLETIEAVGASGAHGAAVVSAALEANDIPERVRSLSASFARGHSRHSVCPS